MKLNAYTVYRRVGLFPIWLVTLGLLPFLPKTHPWKGQKMTLKSWYDLGTDDAASSGRVFLVLFACLIYTSWRIVEGFTHTG